MTLTNPESTSLLRGESLEGRTAMAVGEVRVSAATLDLIRGKQIRKGDVLSVAEIVGIFGAKQTATLFPYCYPNVLTRIDLRFELDEAAAAVRIEAFTKTAGLVSVDMEALTAVSLAALCVVDMCKSVDPGIRIADIQLVSKTGGSGHGLTRN